MDMGCSYSELPDISICLHDDGTDLMGSFKDQVFIPKGTPVVELDKYLDPSRWFQNFVGNMTGSVVATDTPPEEIRRKICLIEQMMSVSVDMGKMEDTVPGYPIVHRFTKGVYVREIHIPAGHMVVGKIHRHEHLNFLSKGRVTVITEQGGVEELEAPMTLISPAGVKRLLFTHEDTVWTTVHATDETDLDKVEVVTIAKSFKELGMADPVLPLIGGDKPWLGAR